MRVCRRVPDEKVCKKKFVGLAEATITGATGRQQQSDYVLGWPGGAGPLTTREKKQPATKIEMDAQQIEQDYT